MYGALQLVGAGRAVCVARVPPGPWFRVAGDCRAGPGNRRHHGDLQRHRECADRAVSVPRSRAAGPGLRARHHTARGLQQSQLPTAGISGHPRPEPCVRRRDGQLRPRHPVHHQGRHAAVRWAVGDAEHVRVSRHAAAAGANDHARRRRSGRGSGVCHELSLVEEAVQQRPQPGGKNAGAEWRAANAGRGDASAVPAGERRHLDAEQHEPRRSGKPEDRVLDAGAAEARGHDEGGGVRLRGDCAGPGQDLSQRFPEEVYGAVEDAHRRRGRAVQGHAVHAAGGGRHAAADRVQQRCQPTAGASDGARTRDCHPCVDGRKPRTHRAATAGGEPDARPRWLPARVPVRLLRTEGCHCGDAGPNDSGGGGAAAELVGLAVCRRRDRAHHLIMRARARAACRARRAAKPVEGYRQGRQYGFPAAASFAPAW